jgi:glycosyltransferase involved in cell wall biosynthesis
VSVTVLIDGHMLGAGETGNETYVRGLLGGLETIGETVTVAVQSADVEVGAHTPLLLPRHSNAARLLVDLPAAARRCRADVIHSTYFAPPRAACARVVTVHDVSFLAHPEWFTRRDLTVLNAGVRFAVRRAERLIVPSQHARGELVARLAVPERRIVVTPEAADARFRPLDDAASEALLGRYGLSRPFVLSVGNQQPRKNMGRLLQAWKLLRQAGHDSGCRLVIAGGHHGRRENLATLVDALDLSECVTLLGYVPNDDVPGLYGAAEALAFPTLYEGFGLPLLEAMACGTPVACSNVTSLPEVASDAAVYFDPLDVTAMAVTLGAILSDAELRAALRRRGLARAAHFTWRECARATVDAYEEAVRERGPR